MYKSTTAIQRLKTFYGLQGIERTSNHDHTIAQSEPKQIFGAQCGFFQLEAPFDSHFSTSGIEVNSLRTNLHCH